MIIEMTKNKVSGIWEKAHQPVGEALRTFGRNERGSVDVGSMFNDTIGLLIALLILIAMAPEIDTAVAGYAGTGLFATILGIAAWAIPSVILVGLIQASVKKHMNN